MFNQSDAYMVKIGQEKYYPRELKDVVINFGYHDHEQVSKLYTMYETPITKPLLSMDHPGVEMIVIYSTKIATENEIYYFKHPQSFRDKGVFYNPDYFGYRKGDGRLTSFSQMLMPLKWALQNDEQKLKKPIKLVEFCSMAHTKMSPYDDEVIANSSKAYEQDFKSFDPNFFSNYLGLMTNRETG